MVKYGDYHFSAGEVQSRNVCLYGVFADVSNRSHDVHLMPCREQALAQRPKNYHILDDSILVINADLHDFHYTTAIAGTLRPRRAEPNW